MGCMVSQLAAKFAFFPPSPPTYQIKKGEDGKITVISSSSSGCMPIPLKDDNFLDVLLIDTKRGNKIVAFYLRNPSARVTLHYSHGNAADLGQLYDLFVQLKPSEFNTYVDIEVVYECLETEYGVSQEELILYGQSVGSGPTLHLAAKLPRLRVVVLHSTILSGLRVVCHVQCTLCFDIYKNINKIKKVKCPVLVIHGTEDDVVNWLHGNGLWKMAKEPYEPLWIKGGGHCNLELYPDYLCHLCKFIHEMENMTTEMRLKKIRQSLHLHSRSTANASGSANRCCKIKLLRLKCSRCPRSSCIKFSMLLKYPKCWRSSCIRCCWLTKCRLCSRTSCQKCSKPSCCQKCSRPDCSMKYLCWNWQCCMGKHSNSSEKQNG